MNIRALLLSGASIVSQQAYSESVLRDGWTCSASCKAARGEYFSITCRPDQKAECSCYPGGGGGARCVDGSKGRESFIKCDHGTRNFCVVSCLADQIMAAYCKIDGSAFCHCS